MIGDELIRILHMTLETMRAQFQFQTDRKLTCNPGQEFLLVSYL